ncbi:type II toxin-antitoxin system prevent-host-death family antitoxin [Streptomyces atratus]|uniref:type II toxin-antitoxin system prevent-host-death family antitoxin n=1 Tax=Streptomyces atratus TaxID=1893 RepID=UPI003652D375
MTYTLDMASDLDPRIADDGIQDVPLTRARALLTRLIEQVREDGLVSALTVRGRRRAYLVTPDTFDAAQSDRRMVRAFHAAAGETPQPETTQDFLALMARKLAEFEEQDAAAARRIADYEP